MMSDIVSERQTTLCGEYQNYGLIPRTCAKHTFVAYNLRDYTRVSHADTDVIHCIWDGCICVMKDRWMDQMNKLMN